MVELICGQEKEIAAHIEDVGFTAKHLSEAENNSIRLAIGGMTCSSCVGMIENNLKSNPHIVSAVVNLATEIGTIVYPNYKLIYCTYILH